jgi:hypothetical protein
VAMPFGLVVPRILNEEYSLHRSQISKDL